jgi:hypothetical protein
MISSLQRSFANTQSAHYVANVRDFLVTEDMSIIGTLSHASLGTVEGEQISAWQAEINILKTALNRVEGVIYLEFAIPRLGGRIDAVVLTGGALIPIEFKVGETHYTRSNIDQAWDYALDLKYFHEASHAADIFPILCATEAKTFDEIWRSSHPDGVRAPLRTNRHHLAEALHNACQQASPVLIDAASWGTSAYRPTPTIIEAAKSLYARHSVDSISRSDAGAKNLHVTSKRVDTIIDEARANGKKAIVFVTGVPGAGKTLVGLNVATKREDRNSPTHAVFLSGNAPLVVVLQESLIRDEIDRLKQIGQKPRKGDVATKVKPFIQNVHHFRDEGVRDRHRPPHDHVVIFDEAQRAWNRDKTIDFMRRKKRISDFSESEPQFLIGYLDRHQDWSVVICLVGGGQEIHTGEAGIGTWLEALHEHYPDWEIHLSTQLNDSEYGAEEWIARLASQGRVRNDSDLHLSVSMRSFRSENVSGFVKSMLDIDLVNSVRMLAEVTSKYPICKTRDLEEAKAWLRSQARGNERYGLLASSQGYRLKPHAIDVRIPIDPVHWFLNERCHVRSSYYLEDAATEFQVQGLELDWSCVTWDADLRFDGDKWSFHSFRGDRWTKVHKKDRARYMINAYRVLLTRARQGMVVFVPPGDTKDKTRLPEYYNGIWKWLDQLGVKSI